MKFRLFYLPFVAGTIGLFSSTNAAESKPPLALSMGNPILAKGIGFEIKQSDMDEVFSNVRANSNSPEEVFPPEAKIQVLNQLIDLQLVLQKATDGDRAEGESKATLVYANIVKSFDPASAFDRQLKAANMTEEKLRARVTQEATAKVTLCRELRITVTDDEVKEFYDSLGPGAYDQPEKVHIHQILLSTTVDSSRAPLLGETIQAKRKLIDELLVRIRSGEDFAALARQYSDDPISKDRGGDFPPFPPSKLEFGTFARSMKPNAVSEVITSKDGYRIIKLIEIIPAKVANLGDVSERIRFFLTTKKMKELAPPFLAQLRKDQNVEIIDTELKAAMAGAESVTAPPL